MGVAELEFALDGTRRTVDGMTPISGNIAHGEIYQQLVTLGARAQVKRKYRNVTGRTNWSSAAHKARNESGKRTDRLDPRWRGR